MNKYISIGFTKKVYGVKGTLKVKIEPEYLEDFLNAKILFLSVHGRQVPYFVDKIHGTSELLLDLDEINSRENAIPLTSKEIFLRPEDIIPEEERMFEVEESLAKYLS